MLKPDMARWAGDTSFPNSFKHAQPFPHLLLENLFRAEDLLAISREFAEVPAEDWNHYRSADEIKAGTRQGARLGSAAQSYFDAIYRGDFLRFLSGITGIENLIPDPSLFGGGLHEIWSGGKFSVHTDFTRHPRTGLTNRLVMITYLNEDWEPSYGGALQLWDARRNACVVEVQPVLGRTIIFEQVPDSLHGHPDPIRAPEGRTRRSITAYFYTAPTRWKDADDSWSSTQFLKNGRLRFSRSDKVKQLIHSVTPPILFEGAKRVRARLP